MFRVYVCKRPFLMISEFAFAFCDQIRRFSRSHEWIHLILLEARVHFLVGDVNTIVLAGAQSEAQRVNVWTPNESWKGVSHHLQCSQDVDLSVHLCRAFANPSTSLKEKATAERRLLFDCNSKGFEKSVPIKQAQWRAAVKDTYACTYST